MYDEKGLLVRYSTGTPAPFAAMARTAPARDESAPKTRSAMRTRAAMRLAIGWNAAKFAWLATLSPFFLLAHRAVERQG